MSAESDKLIPLGDHWSRSEIDEMAFKDARLGRRCGYLLCRLSDRMGRDDPSGLPGLGEHQGGIPVLRKRWLVTAVFGLV
jgi:hypothetical protein